jgi:glutaredoxin
MWPNDQDKLASTIVDKIVTRKDCYVFFYSEWCKYSMQALSLLKSSNACYKGYIIEDIPTNNGDKMAYLLSVLNNSSSKTNFDPNHKTRPIVFYNGTFVGGFTQLQKKLAK